MTTHRNNQLFQYMNVTKSTSNIFEDFDLSLQGATRRKFGLFGIVIYYLLCPIDVGNYNAVWN